VPAAGEGMSPEGTSRRTAALQAAAVALLVAAYLGAAVYFRVRLHSGVVYSHLVYIPVVLAGTWWGWRGTAVAAVLAASVIAMRLAGEAQSPLWSDLARASAVVAAGVCVSALSERASAARRDLAASERRYRLIIEKSLAGILIYRDERILYANGRFGAMTGWTPGELAGRSIWEVISPEDAPRVRELIAERRAKGFTDLAYECRCVKRDGSAMWADVLSSTADLGDGPAVLVNVYDITARKEAQEHRRELSELAERQEEQLVHSTRLAQLGEMAAAMAHEINQPLTGIRNFAANASYMIEEHAGSPEEIRENLRLIGAQVDRAARFIGQMRELTRRADLQLAEVDVNAILTESVEFLRPQLSLNGVEVEMSLSNDLPRVMADRLRIEQVFLNLLNNSLHAMEETERKRLHLATRFEAGTACPVVIEIADTGKGFSREVAAKLFVPFFTTRKAGQGTGLGLSISLGIIQEHGGIIKAAGEPGRGATFTVRLPGAGGGSVGERK